MNHKPSKITIHCSATPNGKTIPIDTLRKWHTSPPPVGRGWSDIGYHMVFQPDGQVDNGRPLNVQGAGVEGANEGNIHLCLIGNDRFTKKQFESLRYKLDSLYLVLDIKNWELYCHHQFKSAIHQGKTCPNIPINRLYCWYFLQDDKAILEFIYE